MTPVLWGRATSVNVQKVMWLLAEIDLPHKRVDAGGRHGLTDSAEFGAMNPTRRVPVWQESGRAVWESHAILRHLGRGPATAFWPQGRARAIADQWMEFTSTTLLPAFIGVFWQKVRLPMGERSVEALRIQSERLRAALDVLDGQLSATEWLAGSQITLADIAAGTPMFRIQDMDVSAPRRPALTRWYRALTERPAYRDTVMTSYDELRGN